MARHVHKKPEHAEKATHKQTHRKPANDAKEETAGHHAVHPSRAQEDGHAAVEPTQERGHYSSGNVKLGRTVPEVGRGDERGDASSEAKRKEQLGMFGPETFAIEALEDGIEKWMSLQWQFMEIMTRSMSGIFFPDLLSASRRESPKQKD